MVVTPSDAKDCVAVEGSVEDDAVYGEVETEVRDEPMLGGSQLGMSRTPLVPARYVLDEMIQRNSKVSSEAVVALCGLGDECAVKPAHQGKSEVVLSTNLGRCPVRINDFASELNWRSVDTQLAPVETMVGDTSVEVFDPKVADNKVKSDLIPCEFEIGDIDPTIELKVEPILASMDKPAEEVMGKSAYAYEVFDKMTEPTLTTDRVSDSEVNVLEVVQSSEGEEAERGEEESPAMEFLEEGPVASESKGKARGKRVVACNVSEKRSLLKQDEPGARFRKFSFDQNGARKSWADIVGTRGILYPKPLGSESNGARSKMELEFFERSENCSGIIDIDDDMGV
ncbi:hypothetical protein U1Q18_037859 [Sarracenia purpurea var. burkii]